MGGHQMSHTTFWQFVKLTFKVMEERRVSSVPVDGYKNFNMEDNRKIMGQPNRPKDRPEWH